MVKNRKVNDYYYYYYYYYYNYYYYYYYYYFTFRIFFKIFLPAPTTHTRDPHPRPTRATHDF